MKLIILDRDGVINEDSDNYIKTPEEWHEVPGSLQAIGRLKQWGYFIGVATNQSGIARGYYTLDTMRRIHQKMTHRLKQHNANIDHIAYCPHGPDDGCACRKPKPALLHDIIRQYCDKTAQNFPLNPDDLAQVVMVGDTIGDYQAANNAGVSFVLVRTGKGIRTLASGQLPDTVPVHDHLKHYVDTLGERFES